MNVVERILSHSDATEFPNINCISDAHIDNHNKNQEKLCLRNKKIKQKINKGCRRKQKYKINDYVFGLSL